MFRNLVSGNKVIKEEFPIEEKLLLKKIEIYRNQMVRLGVSSSFSDRKVIQISKELDKLLYRYQKTKQ